MERGGGKRGEGFWRWRRDGDAVPSWLAPPNPWLAPHASPNGSRETRIVPGRCQDWRVGLSSWLVERELHMQLSVLESCVGSFDLVVSGIGSSGYVESCLCSSSRPRSVMSSFGYDDREARALGEVGMA